MSPLKISSEERAGEEWNISDLVEKKTWQQPEDYISYENNKGKSSIRFINYKARSLDDTDSLVTEQEIDNNRRYSVSEFMEKPNIDEEIRFNEDKIKQIKVEYNSSILHEWPKIREKELYFIRELARLQKLNKDKENSIGCSKKVELSVNNKKDRIESTSKEIKNVDSTENTIKNAKSISEEEQWDLNEKLLLESYEEEEDLINEIYNEQEARNDAEDNNDFINSLDDIELHNLENAMEAMDVSGVSKRKGYGEDSVKSEVEQERPTRQAGTWPPPKEEYPYNYIPGQYAYMGSKRRNFEKTVKFQNCKSDGAILNLSAFDPIDWPNILSVWKSLIVQKYIQNQHNIGNKVEDMITYLETFLGESAKVLWE